MRAKFNQQGSLVMIIVMLMSFLLMSVTFLWRGIMTMHDSAIARQQHMYKKIAIEDLLYYAITHIQKDALQHEYTFERWPLHSRAQWWWRAKVVITTTTDSGHHINATIYDKKQMALHGSCKLTTTIEDTSTIWFIDAWTIE